jgi:hypothetical protein
MNNQQVSQPQQQKEAKLAAEARSVLVAAIGARGHRGDAPGGDEAGIGVVGSARKGLLGPLELVVGCLEG